MGLGFNSQKVSTKGVDGNEVVYDDLRVSPNTLPELGANPPSRVIVANDGSTTTGYAVDFNGSDSKGTTSDYSALDWTDASVNVWLKPDDTDSIELIDRGGELEFYITSGTVTVKVGNRSASSDGTVSVGTTTMVGFTAKTEGSNTRVRIYLNGQLDSETVVNDTFGSNTTGLTIGEYYNGGWNYDGVMDGLYGYNIQLTDAQMTELYNNGEGTTSHPTGVDEATEVVFKFDFEENTGTTVDNNCTLGAGYDMTLNNPTWTDGLMGVTSGSLGVMALAFDPNVDESIFFTAQLPHAYKQGEDLPIHMHWNNKTDDSGDVVMGIEYVWVNIGESGGNTTIAEKTITVSNKGVHKVSDIATLPGTDKKISSILSCRVYRKGSSSSDTYPAKIYMSELDFHVPMDTVGSMQEWVKR